MSRRPLCYWCQRQLSDDKKSQLWKTKDHIWPLELGGTATVACCFKCNQMKANLLPEQWREFMYSNPKWWVQPTGAAKKWFSTDVVPLKNQVRFEHFQAESMERSK